MKILHIIPSYLPAYHIGGPVKSTHDLCKALAGRKLEVSVFTTTIGSAGIPGPLPFKDNIDGVDITYFPSGPFKRYNYAYGISKAIKEKIRELFPQEDRDHQFPDHRSFQCDPGQLQIVRQQGIGICGG